MTDKEKLRKQAREEYARATAPTGKAHYEVRASAKKAYHKRMKEIDEMVNKMQGKPTFFD